jgi:hypothetical protein
MQAPDALEGIAEVGTRQLPGTAIVYQHQVYLLAGGGLHEVAGVRGDGLAGGAAGQQAQEHAQVFLPGNDLFDAHAGNVHFRQVGPQVGVAFVGTHHEAPCFGDRKIYPRDGNVGAEKLFAQVPAGGFGEVLRVGGAFLGAQVLVEEFADVPLLEVNGRQHDVAGRLVAELHDAFAQVGVDHFHALPGQVFVQVALLGEHGFAFHDPLGAVPAHDGVHDPVVLLAVHGPVDVDAVPAGILLKLDQVPVEVGQRVRLDLRSLLPQGFPLGQGVGGFVALAPHEPKGFVVPVGIGFIPDEHSGSSRVVFYRYIGHYAAVKQN